MSKPATDVGVDYAGLYDGYWRRSDRFGEHSFADATPIVAEILRTTGGGRILDVGCGMGLLVRTLLAHGVDAHGLDVSSIAAAHGNSLAPGRFHQGSVLDIPFVDGHFDVVVSTDCMEHLHEQDVPRALSELRRVSRRGVYLRLATTQDRDGHWHLTVKGRDWWEERLFEAGFRKHPRQMTATPYEALEHDGWQITLIHERLPDVAVAEHPVASLRSKRDLHMDMLRETGRRADAHVARYQLAAGLVRPNDVVLDVACGMGYGAATLAANSEASQILGVDLDAQAVCYANATTGACWPQATFQKGDATKLGFLPDASIDLITSFETLEHVPDPEAALREFARVLKPAGRIVVSVPHMWVDETGRDPNPHHLHVYDWPRLRDQLAKCFLVEALWAQTAGGGMKLADHPRRIARATIDEECDTPAEWWLAAAMKTPADASVASYQETSYPTAPGAQPPNIIAFGRDYRNPWLVKAMIARGQRVLDEGVLAQLANETLRRTPPASGSADAGAALCVLAYRTLGDRSTTAAGATGMLEAIDAFCALDPGNPTVLRWQISLHYAAARLLLMGGRRTEAADRFRRCGSCDAAGYSALLGTKTVDAWLQAGLMAVADGDVERARSDWQRALSDAERLLRSDWTNMVGDLATPIAFGLREAAEVMDLAARAARALVDLPTWAKRPGHAYEQAAFGMRPAIDLLERTLAEARAWKDRILQENGRLREAVAAMPNGDLAAAQETVRGMIEAKDRQIAALERMRGIKGTIRGLLDRLRG